MDVVLRNKNVVMTEGYNWYEDGMGNYETYFRKQRGSLYGYPLNSTGEQFSLDNIQDLRDPMYGMWTPPYFYGDSVVRISFAPHEFDGNLAAPTFVSLLPPTLVFFTVRIFAPLRISSRVNLRKWALQHPTLRCIRLMMMMFLNIMGSLTRLIGLIMQFQIRC
jgi:hypothetical protein